MPSPFLQHREPQQTRVTAGVPSEQPGQTITARSGAPADREVRHARRL